MYYEKVKFIRVHWLGGIRGPKEQIGSAGISMFFRWLLLNNLKKEKQLRDSRLLD